MRLIGNVEKDAQVRAVASGALPSGDAVVVNSDGTVSVVGPISFPQEVGSPSVFESAYSGDIRAAFDSNTNKVVVAYRDGGNNNVGTAVVGTVSGTSISFGTPVVFRNVTVSNISIAYDTNAQKVVITYTGTSNYGYAIVGTVSGTSISFGTEVAFENAITTFSSVTYDESAQKITIAYRDGGNGGYGTAIVGTVSGTSISFGSPVVFESADVEYISATYDTNTQRVVVAYQDRENNNYGTAIVGTVSGTSISFGSPVVFESAEVYNIFAVYDIFSQKVVVVYQDAGNSNYGTSIVGTVSGTSISFGSATVFNSAATTQLSATYDANAQKVVVAYQDGGNSNYGTVRVGTVSGTSISFGSSSVFESANSQDFSLTFDSSAEKVVILYRDNGNSDYGTSVIFQAAYSAPNLTSENFIGFAAHTYADGQSALVNSTCTVDRNQTGLTAGQTYYVQTDGTLGTTAADPSVEAGTAISSTEIIVKG